MKKIKLIICLFIIVILSGCDTKSAITNEKFIKEAKNNNYYVSDITSQYSGVSYIESANLAYVENEWQVEFFVFESTTKAMRMFDKNKEKFKSYRFNYSSEYDLNMNNYSIYSLTSNNKYMYISRVENTLIYVSTIEQHKDEVTKFIEKLGY